MISRIFLFYKRHIGSWWWIVHRLTGLALVIYLVLHLWELHTLAYEAPDAFNHKMLIFQSLPFKFMEWMLVGVVLVHALNGVRIMIVDFFGGARHNHVLSLVTFLVMIVLFLAAGYPMFLMHLL